MATDPVCKMEVEEKKWGWYMRHNGGMRLQLQATLPAVAGSGVPEALLWPLPRRQQ